MKRNEERERAIINAFIFLKTLSNIRTITRRGKTYIVELKSTLVLYITFTESDIFTIKTKYDKNSVSYNVSKIIANYKQTFLPISSYQKLNSINNIVEKILILDKLDPQHKFLRIVK